jgi:hypothetical protein
MRPSPEPSIVPRAVGGVLALVVAVGALVIGPPAQAEGPARRAAPAVPGVALAAPSPDLPGLPQTSVELAKVSVASPAFDRAAEQYQAVNAAHTVARQRRHDLDASLTELAGKVATLTAERSAALARMAGLDSRLVVLEEAIQDLAVNAFVGGDDEARFNEAMASETPAINEGDRRQVYRDLSMDVLLREREVYLTRRAEAQERADQAAAGLAAATGAATEVLAARPAASEAEVARGTDVAAERVTYEEARVLATVDGVEFPLVALDAYYRAATIAATERPGCRVRWWGLAGISRVEGRHGTYGGTTLEPNGDTSRRIIGIQLNGDRNTAVIGDSDGGALDGDASFDRAVGPMQFIPQTWRRYQADGNDDGEASPFNLYDATLAAAHYLCTASSALDGDDGLRSAYFSYNHSIPYVDAVLGYARGYEKAVVVPEPVDGPATPP